jgi:hypothetical protein
VKLTNLFQLGLLGDRAKEKAATACRLHQAANWLSGSQWTAACAS